MHSGKRSIIEKEIKQQMSNILENRGFIIEAILLKSITLPSGLYAAIESKLRAEQQAQQQSMMDEQQQSAMLRAGEKIAGNIPPKTLGETIVNQS